MPNEKNLIPFTSEQSREEAVKNGSVGGKASGKSRRRRKSMKQVMDMLLQMPANTVADWELLINMGINVDELDEDIVNNILVVNVALLKKAKEGDVASIKELRDIIQDNAIQNEKIKLEKEYLKLEKQKIAPPTADAKVYSGIPASLIAPAFSAVLFDIADYRYSEYVFPGGRGSTKSSFISLNVIDLLKKNEQMHACVLRNVGNTLKDTVYSQIQWAVSALGLDDEFTFTKAPLEITRTLTGQKIYFRGADAPNKNVSSMKKSKNKRKSVRSLV